MKLVRRGIMFFRGYKILKENPCFMLTRNYKNGKYVIWYTVNDIIFRQYEVLRGSKSALFAWYCLMGRR